MYKLFSDRVAKRLIDAKRKDKSQEVLEPAVARGDGNPAW
jgi:hypothetical protein